jgi:1-deoxy-D-xylulose-5-phosphate reductoisomerase
MKRNVAILGSTGSIGTQALDVIANNLDIFQVELLTANNNVDLLIEQAVRFQPNCVVISNESQYSKLAEALKPYPIKVFAGYNSICQAVQMESTHIVLTAMVGFAGLQPTIKAIEAGKHIALANKETLVVAGELITALAKKHRVNILPVDSEHSAIFQCLAGEQNNAIDKIILTASGGPFRGKSRDFLAKITKVEALQHPNWNMGAKVTIDSASLMNKGLEAIEARWLFDLKPSQIEVLVHPQSIIHSMVQFEDGSIKAQLGLPDMRLPIQYALGFPFRLKSNFPRLNFADYATFTFESPNLKVFRNLALAYEALEKGGNLPCIMNAANEVVVEAFLNDKVKFMQMPDIIEKTMLSINYKKHPTLDDYTLSDKEARAFTQSIL